MGSFSHRRDPLDEPTSKERAEARERGEVPKRFGGTREQGVRNTMGNVPSASVGSFKRGGDPLDRYGVRGDPRDERGNDYGRGDAYRLDRDRDDRRDRDRDEYRRDRDRRDRDRDRDSERRSDRDRDGSRRDTPRTAAPSSTNAPPQRPTAAPSATSMRLIEVIANDRLGRKGMSLLLQFVGLLLICEGSTGQVPSYRYCRRPQTSYRRPNWYDGPKDSA